MAMGVFLIVSCLVESLDNMSAGLYRHIKRYGAEGLLLLSHFLPPPPPATGASIVLDCQQLHMAWNPYGTGNGSDATRWVGTSNDATRLMGAANDDGQSRGNGRVNPAPGSNTHRPSPIPSRRPFQRKPSTLILINHSTFSEGLSSDGFGLNRTFNRLIIKSSDSSAFSRFASSEALDWDGRSMFGGSTRSNSPAFDMPQPSALLEPPPRNRLDVAMGKLTDPFTMDDVFDFNWQRSDRVWIDEGVYSEYDNFPNTLKLASFKKILRLEHVH
ncbi:hypothetical protein GGX14DRAFT_627568 [Mycena pura]|uniref:Uncharacterized protein n=1 Tax=Mycena pura TaxID=153505 RepID=A0AAD7E4A2_9AGAR|nr:hypothetical protein GGX14DRAFT_627568 [Mycena pura]